jgi:hypothetical protein
MRFRYLVMLAVLSLGVPAGARTERAPGPPQRGPRGGEGGPAPARTAIMLDRMAVRLTNDLNLDEQQKTELSKIVADFKERANQMPPSGPEGDQPRGRPGLQLMSDFFDKVRTILDDQQAAKLQQIRDDMGQRLREGGMRGGVERAIQELPDKLKLDDAQKAQFDKLVAQHREQAQARQQRMRELQPIIEEMRKARESGDTQRAAELQKQIDQARQSMGNPAETFYSELVKILRPDQQETLKQYRQETEERGAGPGAGPGDVRTIARAVRRLELDEQQRVQVKEILKSAEQKSHDLGRDEPQAQAGLARDTKAQIVKLLRPEQVQKFEEALTAEQAHRNQDQPGAGEGKGREHRPAPAGPEKPKP